MQQLLQKILAHNNYQKNSDGALCQAKWRNNSPQNSVWPLGVKGGETSNATIHCKCSWGPLRRDPSQAMQQLTTKLYFDHWEPRAERDKPSNPTIHHKIIFICFEAIAAVPRAASQAMQQLTTKKFYCCEQKAERGKPSNAAIHHKIIFDHLDMKAEGAKGWASGAPGSMLHLDSRPCPELQVKRCNNPPQNYFQLLRAKGRGSRGLSF